MKKEKAIRLTVTRDYSPSEGDHYDELLESVAPLKMPASKWLDENIIAAASYDRFMVAEGGYEVLDYLYTAPDEEPIDYLFQVIEYTTHDDGHVTEEVVHTIRDTTYDDTAKLPNTIDLLMLNEAKASVALDGETWALEE